MIEKLRELLNKKLSKETTRNWYYILGASMITASFYAPSTDAMLILIFAGLLVLATGTLLYYGKGE